jgi:hypothetical protein
VKLLPPANPNILYITTLYSLSDVWERVYLERWYGVLTYAFKLNGLWTVPVLRFPDSVSVWSDDV